MPDLVSVYLVVLAMLAVFHVLGSTIRKLTAPWASQCLSPLFGMVFATSLAAVAIKLPGHAVTASVVLAVLVVASLIWARSELVIRDPTVYVTVLVVGLLTAAPLS